MSARQPVRTRAIARQSRARLITGQMTLMMCARPAARQSADVTWTTARFSALLVTAVQLTAVFARRTTLAAGRLQRSALLKHIQMLVLSELRFYDPFDTK